MLDGCCCILYMRISKLLHNVSSLVKGQERSALKVSLLTGPDSVRKVIGVSSSVVNKKTHDLNVP